MNKNNIRRPNIKFKALCLLGLSLLGFYQAATADPAVSDLNFKLGFIFSIDDNVCS